jgi:CTP synthase (UTP-ammonia lyase)
MNASIKVGIVGDFSFMYNAHHATNHALEHSRRLFESNLDYYWIRTTELAEGSLDVFDNFDGIIIAPGPYVNEFFMKIVMNKLAEKEMPVLGTGESFKMYIEHLAKKYYADQSDNVISENQNKTNHFEKQYLHDPNGDLLKLYGSRPLVEYSSIKYLMNPEIQKFLEHNAINVLAKEEDGNLLAFSDKEKPYFVFSMFCPQVLSSEALPHPIFTNFIEEILKFKLLTQVI